MALITCPPSSHFSLARNYIRGLLLERTVSSHAILVERCISAEKGGKKRQNFTDLTPLTTGVRGRAVNAGAATEQAPHNKAKEGEEKPYTCGNTSKKHGGRSNEVVRSLTSLKGLGDRETKFGAAGGGTSGLSRARTPRLTSPHFVLPPPAKRRGEIARERGEARFESRKNPEHGTFATLALREVPDNTNKRGKKKENEEAEASEATPSVEEEGLYPGFSKRDRTGRVAGGIQASVFAFKDARPISPFDRNEISKGACSG
ncbi:hypothetical protein WN55_06347 [Dufourea novaeangliae]|uniref:Uncharacterized protein n=1 Tax=Dufourea novaeangliae TaxID=178035 RepID=A0A154PQC0_DUFNO|nr:hypothetical protein WN55_06347 [Dufourea novaeangliae]